MSPRWPTAPWGTSRGTGHRHKDPGAHVHFQRHPRPVPHLAQQWLGGSGFRPWTRHRCKLPLPSASLQSRARS